MRRSALLLATLATIVLTDGVAFAVSADSQEVWLSCSGVGATVASPASPYVFKPSALNGKPGAENGGDPAAAGLRDAIHRMLPYAFPAHSYVLLRQTSDHVLYGHVGPRARIDETISLVLRDGQWQFEMNGGCVLGRVFFGRVAAAFGLDGRQDPKARALNVGVTLGTCGRDPDPSKLLDRVLLVWRRGTLQMTVLTLPPTPTAVVTPPGPGGDPTPVCAGIGESFAVRVALPRPVGTRTIVDGAYYPPRPVHWTRHPSRSLRPIRTIVAH